MAKHGADNLVRNEARTPEERRENARKAGIASGEARRRKKSIKQGVIALMKEETPDQVKRAFSRSGYDVATNADAMVAAILTGAIRGNPRMIERVMEMIGEDPRANARKAELEIAKERLKIEQERARLDLERQAMENERQRLWMAAITGDGQAEIPSDGFIEALSATAGPDWIDGAGGENEGDDGTGDED